MFSSFALYLLMLVGAVCASVLLKYLQKKREFYFDPPIDEINWCPLVDCTCGTAHLDRCGGVFVTES